MILKIFLIRGSKLDIHAPSHLVSFINSKLNFDTAFLDPHLFDDVKQHVLNTNLIDLYDRFVSHSSGWLSSFVENPERCSTRLFTDSAKRSPPSEKDDMDELHAQRTTSGKIMEFASHFKSMKKKKKARHLELDLNGDEKEHSGSSHPVTPASHEPTDTLVFPSFDPSSKPNTKESAFLRRLTTSKAEATSRDAHKHREVKKSTRKKKVEEKYHRRKEKEAKMKDEKEEGLKKEGEKIHHTRSGLKSPIAFLSEKKKKHSPRSRDSGPHDEKDVINVHRVESSSSKTPSQDTGNPPIGNRSQERDSSSRNDVVKTCSREVILEQAFAPLSLEPEARNDESIPLGMKLRTLSKTKVEAHPRFGLEKVVEGSILSSFKDSIGTNDSGTSHEDGSKTKTEAFQKLMFEESSSSEDSRSSSEPDYFHLPMAKWDLLDVSLFLEDIGLKKYVTVSHESYYRFLSH